jgi:hypothetical protein
MKGASQPSPPFQRNAYVTLLEARLRQGRSPDGTLILLPHISARSNNHLRFQS